MISEASAHSKVLRVLRVPFKFFSGLPEALRSLGSGLRHGLSL